jgi:hypothetical protein
MSEYGKSQLIKMLTNVPAEGWSRQKVKDMVDTLWRDPVHLRWSGFEYAGGTDCNMSFNESTRVFTVSPKIRAFSYFQMKTKLSYHVHTTAFEVAISDTEGLHVIYFADDPETKKQVLLSIRPSSEEIEDIYLHKVIVAWLYWIPEDPITEEPGRVIYYGDSRHGSEWPSQVHWWNHRTLNSLRETGLTITGTQSDQDGSQNSHAQLEITAGSVMHSDIRQEIDGSSPASLPIWFMVNGAPNIVSNPGYVFAVSGTICYNDGTGSTPAQDDKFVMYHLFATNCLLEPLISAMGLAQYNTLGDAMKSAQYEIDLIRQTFPHSNMMLIDTVIFQTSSAYGNAVKTRLVTTVVATAGNDEKVALASAATGNITGDPGYLDDRYFYPTLVASKLVYRPIERNGDIYYLHVNDADIENYKYALRENPDDAEDTVECTATNSEELIQEYVTRAGFPGVSVIPAGFWIFETWLSLTTLADEHRLKIRVYKLDTDDNETLLFTVEEPVTELDTSCLRILTGQEDIVLLPDDRLIFRYYYVTTRMTPSTLTLYMEGSENYSRIYTPVRDPGVKDNDERVKYDADDPAAGYLSEKIIAGENVTIAEGTGENAKKLVISVTISSGTDGREVELRVDSGYVQWRYVGDESWTNLIALATITGADGAPGTPGADGQDGAPGTPGADGEDGREVELRVDSGYVQWRYVGDVAWTNLIELTAIKGDAGTSTYTYVAYASDNAGTGFSLTPTDLLKYRAEIHVQAPLTPPTSSDFSSAVWVKYIGDDGESGGGGGGDVPPELHLDFDEAGDVFVYNVPYDMKFISQVSENTAATIDPVLNTILPRYTKLTITATSAGLVSLYGEYL